MSSVSDWLEARTPAPPEPLARWMEDVPGLGDGEETSTSGMTGPLLTAGLEELDRARQAPGRVRQSAFHLLAADALLTYACEAALEEPDPEEALMDALRNAGARER